MFSPRSDYRALLREIILYKARIFLASPLFLPMLTKTKACTHQKEPKYPQQ